MSATNACKPFDAIADVLLSGSSTFEAKVRRFSDARCADYSMPLHLIHSFLMDAEYHPDRGRNLSRFRSLPEFKALGDMVSLSPLNQYLILTVDTAELAFADSVSLEQRIELSRFIASKTGGIE